MEFENQFHQEIWDRSQKEFWEESAVGFGDVLNLKNSNIFKRKYDSVSTTLRYHHYGIILFELFNQI